MRINGAWHPCDDGVLRPVIQGEALAANGDWVQVPFLVDTGADKTVFSADIAQVLGLDSHGVSELLGGVGGQAESVIVRTSLRLFQDNGGDVVFKGQFHTFTDPGLLDMSVLGRNLLDVFAIIIDRPGNCVCMLSQRHHYLIVEK